MDLMDWKFYMDMLNVDSTTGREGEFTDMVVAKLVESGCKVQRFPVETMSSVCADGCKVPENLLFSWGEPKVIFCTHLDTVPPYFSPEIVEDENGNVLAVKGRGTCDAKGQIFSMYEACMRLCAEGYEGFGLLLLAGEETGSFGAKAFNDQHPGAEWVIVGEPTDNHMTSASKGTKSFELTFEGKAAHSGYPEQGVSAVDLFNQFYNALNSIEFPEDEVLGKTTWNIGKLESANPQNILSEKLTCRLYFRTTFASDQMVCNIMKNIAGETARLRFGRNRAQDGSDLAGGAAALWQKNLTIKAFGGDTPMSYAVLDGFSTKPVAFGSDAPQLHNFKNKILCGPGSILVAHKPSEHIKVADLEAAVDNYVRMFKEINRSFPVCDSASVIPGLSN